MVTEALFLDDDLSITEVSDVRMPTRPGFVTVQVRLSDTVIQEEQRIMLARRQAQGKKVLRKGGNADDSIVDGRATAGMMKVRIGKATVEVPASVARAAHRVGGGKPCA